MGTEITTEMVTDEPVQTVAQVDMLKERHKEIKAEIDAREDVFGDIVSVGRGMIEDGNHQSKEIEEKIEDLLILREKLHATWQERNEYLRQLHAQKAFYRDANQLDAISHQQEA